MRRPPSMLASTCKSSEDPKRTGHRSQTNSNDNEESNDRRLGEHLTNQTDVDRSVGAQMARSGTHGRAPSRHIGAYATDPRYKAASCLSWARTRRAANAATKSGTSTPCHRPTSDLCAASQARVHRNVADPSLPRQPQAVILGVQRCG